MEDKKYINALEIKEMCHIQPGHTIKIYDEERTVTGFQAQYNEGLEKWETIILTDGRGDPFERSLDVIEVLPDQPWNMPLQKPGPVWVKASERLPNTGLVVWRWLDKTEAYTGYKEKGGLHFGTGGARVDPTYYSEIEWLDESAPSGEREGEAVAFAEWIDAIATRVSTTQWRVGGGSIEAIATTSKLYEQFKNRSNENS